MPVDKSFRKSVKFGQVYRALRDIPVHGSIIYRAPASGGFQGTLHAGTKIVIVSNPHPDAKSAQAMPLNYGELEKKLVPQKELSHPLYGYYGVSVMLNDLDQSFIREYPSEIHFDDERAQKEWGLIVKYTQGKDS